MADLRLKTVTIEGVLLNPTQELTIKSGDVRVTNTTISTSVLNGSLISNGGISINCTYDAISSTSGGALSVGGGLSVHNQTILGNNLILDSNSSVISVEGISEYRMFLDTINNKNFYISPNGITKRFNLYDTYCNINITTDSTNATSGAFIVNGGISINSTTNAVNSSNGGALTVGGGISIGGDSHLSKSLIIGELYNNNYGLLVRYTGNSQIALQNSSGTSTTTLNMDGNTLKISNAYNTLFNTTFGSFTFSNSSSGNTLFTINPNYSVFDKYVSITDTIESLNVTSASLIVTGGLSVKCTTDSISSTNGGGLSLGGGLAIAKKTYTGDSIGIELSNNNKNNKLMLYQIDSDLTQTDKFAGVGVTNGSLRFQLPDSSNDYVFYSSLTSGNASTEVFKIKGTNEVQFIGSQQKYSVIGGGSTTYDLSIQGQSLAEPSSVGFYTNDGDGGDNNDVKIFGLGLPNNVNNSEYFKIGWEFSNSQYVISTQNNGSGIERPIILQTNSNINQLSLITNGSISTSSTIPSSNSSSGSFILYGGLSINSTSDTTSLTSGGGITLNGGMSVKKSVYIGNTLNIYSTDGNIQLYSNTSGDLLLTNHSDNFIYAGNTTSQKYQGSLSLFTLNNNFSSNYEVLSLNVSNTNANAFYNINSQAGGTGVTKPLQINIGSNTGMFLDTSGRVGINTTSPTYQIDINGTVQANNYNYFNQLTVYSTLDATDEFTSGSLTVQGGASIVKSLFVGGDVVFTSTTESTSSSASLFLEGGLTITSIQDGTHGSGALTVAGGAYFGEEVHIEQDLWVYGSINGAEGAANSFAYITITATDEAINITTGCLITFGGITIQANTNSQSVTDGGSFLTLGGASIGKDMYIGGDLNNYGITSYYDTTNNLIKFYDTSNFTAFSIDRNTSTSDFSISRYNASGIFVEKSINIARTNGQITVNNSTASLNSTTGSIITNGGITINTTNTASDLSNGGGLTIYGGASINKNLLVDGDVVFSSTTASTSSNDGALIINGGVGITGNVNITGNTVITGDLTITGTTNNISTTNTLIADNILLLNSGPSGSSDAGFIIERYQLSNDSNGGDVVNDGSSYNFILDNQSGMTTTEIKLTTAASVVDDFYNGWWVKILTGFSAGQVRQITDYIGSTRVATIDAIWTTSNPSIGDSINLYNRSYTGLIWDEINDIFVLGTSALDPTTTLTFTEYSSLHADSAIFTSSINSINSSVGALVITGGVGIRETTDAISTISGGALTVAGGASILKKLYVGDTVIINGIDIQPNQFDLPTTTTFIAANNTTANIDLLLFDSTVWGADIYLSIRLVATSNLYSNYHLRIVNTTTTWELIDSYVGDQIVTFSITNGGQIQYTAQNFTGFTSLTFKYKVVTN